MSAETKRALAEAIEAHYRSDAEGDVPERETAVVVDWVVGYTVSNVVNIDGDDTVGYANGYDSQDTNPNSQAYLAQWVATRIGDLLEGDRDDG
ncbi:hypothetical protein EDF22_0637 [Rathayibacter sp. PhB127]|uniref:hypothetical protein n=1 Tax=Rathayibacter sp. PhB127 TaxID=2485176 RepID=UPI000F4C6928|nr:hypothetical protein [Rathayibacter sp. PhB127]ROS28905.1 hypothetical protein EDF22_0637 [Rathayibacter sp. PhB127]